MPDTKTRTSLGNIVVIDDEESICLGCKLPLTDLGHTVETFLKGGAALYAIQQNGCDLILLDPMAKIPEFKVSAVKIRKVAVA